MIQVRRKLLGIRGLVYVAVTSDPSGWEPHEYGISANYSECPAREVNKNTSVALFTVHRAWLGEDGQSLEFVAATGGGGPSTVINYYSSTINYYDDTIINHNDNTVNNYNDNTVNNYNDNHISNYGPNTTINIDGRIVLNHYFYQPTFIDPIEVNGGDVNNLNITGQGVRVRVFSDEHFRAITGLNFGVNPSGRIVSLHNVGNFVILLPNDSEFSLVQNRILTTTENDYWLAPGHEVTLWYDGVTGRIRVSENSDERLGGVTGYTAFSATPVNWEIKPQYEQHRIAATVPVNLPGIAFPKAGLRHRLFNYGNEIINLTHESIVNSEEYRFNLPGGQPMELHPGMELMVDWDETDARWHVVAYRDLFHPKEAVYGASGAGRVIPISSADWTREFEGIVQQSRDSDATGPEHWLLRRRAGGTNVEFDDIIGAWLGYGIVNDAVELLGELRVVYDGTGSQADGRVELLSGDDGVGVICFIGWPNGQCEFTTANEIHKLLGTDGLGRVINVDLGDNLTFVAGLLDATPDVGVIAVAGQPDVEATNPHDTVTLVAGTGMTITTDATAKTVTFTADAGAGGGIGTATLMWYKFTVTYTQLAAAATNKTYKFADLPAGSAVHAACIKPTTIFTGGSLSSYNVTFNINGNNYAASYEVRMVSISDTAFQYTFADQTPYDTLWNFGSTVPLNIIANSTGANLNAATQGSLDIYLLISTVNGTTGGAGGGAGNAFGIVTVAGQTDIEATADHDTLKLIAGSNVTLTTNVLDKSVTIAAAGGGVTSVNGYTGVVVLHSDDISDTGRSHKFVTPSDLIVIGNTSGTNTGDQTITLTGHVTGSGTGSFATTISNGVVTNAMLANMAASTVKGRRTSTGDPEDLTFTQLLDLVGSAAQGDLLFRGGSDWQRLPAGTSGQFLKTFGAGANPAWAATPVGATTLDELTDVATAGLVSGNVLTYNGSLWVPQAPVAAPVSSVNGQTGTVVLDSDDIDDTGHAHKFVTAADLTKLGNLSGVNTGDQTITLTGHVTGSGTGSFATTIANGVVTNAMLVDMIAGKIKGRQTSTGAPQDLSLSEVLDFIGSAAQGDLLYRGAAGWERLGAGASGQYLKTQGASANPIWATVTAGGTGDVVGPAASVDGELALFDGTTGKLIKRATGSGVVHCSVRGVFGQSHRYGRHHGC